jgi:hypothetical protein
VWAHVGAGSAAVMPRTRDSTENIEVTEQIPEHDENNDRAEAATPDLFCTPASGDATQ